ncbi:hypothetical protein CLOM_g9250 [Closterium sp. NIES-68]|nr:hypothetical protein CLOM_g9250 [Closterium sp. NIES-68]GJP60231.1 hypothetical protein CLOP_g17442 [Closterium sp. NIES-67]
MAATCSAFSAVIHTPASLRGEARFDAFRSSLNVSFPRESLGGRRLDQLHAAPCHLRNAQRGCLHRIRAAASPSSSASASPSDPGHSSSPTLPEPLIPLGQSELRVSPLGIGTLQWGDPRSGFGEQYSAADVADAFRTALAGGINLFDSAEVYGYQSIPTGNSSEQLLGRFVAEERERRLREGSSSTAALQPVVASKFFTIPWTNLLVGGGLRFGGQSLIDALKASLQRLGMERVDLYQIHFPFPTISNATLMDALKHAHAEGLATAVGVSNYNTQQLQEAHTLLKAAGIPLASNQVKFNLLDRSTETNGLLQACKDLQVSLIAYSPLASGLLTGKALARTDKDAVRVRPLLQLMKAIGEECGGKSVSQVALNYIMCKGAIPIPGCKTASHATSHLGSMGWRLTPEHVVALEEKAQQVR